MNEDKRQARGL